MAKRSAPNVLIIGGGPGGICLGIKLKQQGIPFTIIEREDGFGGVWRQNTYPGCGCDVPSIFFHFSFAPKGNWERKWAKQPEILEYFEELASKHGLSEDARFHMEAVRALFDEPSCTWKVVARRTTDNMEEEFHAEVVVSAMGQLSRPFVPQLAGMDTFRGPLFHANRWDWSVDLVDKRIAVIGNGATAVQFVPVIARNAKQLTVFQRSPNHYMCGPLLENHKTTALAKWTLSNVPGALFLSRLISFWSMEIMNNALGTGLLRWVMQIMLRQLVPDAELRQKLTASYPPGCRRILIGEAGEYLRTLQEPNAQLEMSAIERIVPEGVETETRVFPFDVIVLSTGFQTQDFLSPLSVVSRGVELNALWQRTPRAHLGIAVAGFPNFFMMYGPNTNTGAGSILFFLECQANYICKMIARMRSSGFRSVVVKESVMDSFNEQLQSDLQRTVFAKGCGSWYVNQDGVITNNWSGSMTSYWMKTRKPNPTDYKWDSNEAEHTGARAAM